MDKIEIKDEICNKWSIVLATFTNFMINITTCIVHDKETTQHKANEIIVIGKQFISFFISVFLLVYLHFLLIEWMIVIEKWPKVYNLWQTKAIG